MSEKDKIKAAIKMLVENGEDLSKMLETGGLMHKLKKGLMEKALEAEMDEHMGYEKYDRSGEANSRNGTISKNLITESGPIELEVPRDREGTFAPQLVKKRQTRINGLDEKILSLYAKGMTLSDMRMQLKELYATDISESLISRVTDNVIEEVKIWQNRALDKVYPIVYFDCLVVKVREDKRIINKSVYLALGINMDGIRDILGLWISNNEGAKFWLNNMTELKNRGLEDILIACTDNLTGMNDAIKSVFPKTEHQLCIVHQIRNSLKYVSYKDRKTLVADLKPVYTASSEDSASLALDSFDEKWSKKYPQIVKSWKNNWDNLVIFLSYPPAIRRIIYTTNAIESVNSRLRKTIKNKRVFPNDNSVFKILFLSINYITLKWSMPVKNWNEAISHFLIKFDDRLDN